MKKQTRIENEITVSKNNESQNKSKKKLVKKSENTRIGII